MITSPSSKTVLVLTALLVGVIGLVSQLPLLASAPKEATTAPAKKPVAAVAAAQPAGPQLPTTSLALVRHPEQYLNKTVRFEGEFTGFTGLGLDYSKALRPAKEYVGLLVRRPDVRNHVIPLSELKMFYPRAKSETLTTLEAGDQVAIVGSVFSNALGEPWLDVTQLTITKKKAK